MGVGKSSVARHLSRLTGRDLIDLDLFIEKRSGKKIASILVNEGEAALRVVEAECLRHVLEQTSIPILSLGGGTWTIPENRDLIRALGLTSVWLESTFEHCWTNIRKSRKKRPLAQNRAAALELFESRRAIYCLADWHFIVRPDLTSYDIARMIAEEIVA
jgi:shikimate kinase